MKLHIFSNLKTPKYLLIFLGSALVLFDLNYYLMSSLPGSRNEMCVMGVNLTAGNILFSIVLSLLTGLLIAGLFGLLAKRGAHKKAALTSLSGVGLGVGALTFFCPLCALPVISIAGLSVVLQLFNDYNLLFKLASLLIIGAALFMMNRQLADDCQECALVPKKK